MRTRTPAILALSLLTVALAACNRDKVDSDTATTTTPPPAEDVAAAPADEPAPAAEPASYTVDKIAIAGEGDKSYLTDTRGRRLYVLEGDTSGSKCIGECITKFRPVTGSLPVSDIPDVSAASLGTITRSDGSTQVTYYGQPLYFYDDGTPVTDEVTVVAEASPWGNWYLVRPDGTTIALKEGVPTTDSPTAAGADARDLPTQSPGGKPGEVD